MTLHTDRTTSPHHRMPHWLHRVGKLGFAFFFIKGVAWMLLPLAFWLMD